MLLLISSLGEFIATKPSQQALTAMGVNVSRTAMETCLVAVDKSDELSNPQPPEINHGSGISVVYVHLN